MKKVVARMLSLIAVAGGVLLLAPHTGAIASHPWSPWGTQQWGGGCSGICSSHDKPLCYCCDSDDCDGAEEPEDPGDPVDPELE